MKNIFIYFACSFLFLSHSVSSGETNFNNPSDNRKGKYKKKNLNEVDLLDGTNNKKDDHDKNKIDIPIVKLGSSTNYGTMSIEGSNGNGDDNVIDKDNDVIDEDDDTIDEDDDTIDEDQNDSQLIDLQDISLDYLQSEGIQLNNILDKDANVVAITNKESLEENTQNGNIESGTIKSTDEQQMYEIKKDGKPVLILANGPSNDKKKSSSTNQTYGVSNTQQGGTSTTQSNGTSSPRPDVASTQPNVASTQPNVPSTQPNPASTIQSNETLNASGEQEVTIVNSGTQISESTNFHRLLKNLKIKYKLPNSNSLGLHSLLNEILIELKAIHEFYEEDYRFVFLRFEEGLSSFQFNIKEFDIVKHIIKNFISILKTEDKTKVVNHFKRAIYARQSGVKVYGLFLYIYSQVKKHHNIIIDFKNPSFTWFIEDIAGMLELLIV